MDYNNTTEKLIWHHIITRDLNTIDIDLQKTIKLSKNRDTYKIEVVDRIMANAVTNFLPEVELYQDRN